ncbi:DUF5789 family protein [Halapricum salinum]|uniref:DUF5789 family protein n=1 Tax=Halapricum salinum TaxID=1457250 RepID=UPI000678BADF|nr:hypothetical protein [Halapricum salinum]
MALPITDRELGVYFGDFGETLSEQEYPMTARRLREKFADQELEISGESVSFASLLAPIEETFESSEQLLATILMMVGMDAVGRKRYTDRGGSAAIDQEVGPQTSL